MNNPDIARLDGLFGTRNTQKLLDEQDRIDAARQAKQEMLEDEEEDEDEEDFDFERDCGADF